MSKIPPRRIKSEDPRGSEFEDVKRLFDRILYKKTRFGDELLILKYQKELEILKKWFDEYNKRGY